MKRDMDLIRLLLLDFEGEEEVGLSNYTEEQLSYHIYLLIDGGLAVGNVSWANGSDGNPQIIASSIARLTWEGHEFLDAARNETIWKKTTGTVTKAGGAFTFAILKAALTTTIKVAIEQALT